MLFKHQLFLALACLPMLLTSQAHAQTYEINWYTVDCGGEMFTFGGIFELSGSIGQPDAGTLSGGVFELAGGFWPATQPPPNCPADINGDGAVDVLDFFAFVTAFAAGDPVADINGDGAIDVLDFFAFVAAFAAGCP